MNWTLIASGTAASLAAGFATGVGALPILFIRTLSDPVKNAFLGFSAGVMLSASFFSLILPAIADGDAQYGGKVVATFVVAASVMLGAAALALINDYVPHEHFVLGRSGVETVALRRIWLFVIAITLHNFPEGLAVGVGFGGNDLNRGIALAIGIGLQNMPEGLAVAASLLSLNYSRTSAILIAFATGMVEPVGGLLGVTAVSVFAPLLPLGLGLAAGAMIFVVSNEIIPETHRSGNENLATFGLMVGLIVMMLLDVTLA